MQRLCEDGSAERPFGIRHLDKRCDARVQPGPSGAAHRGQLLCAQSYRNLEIIVADDCSSDDIEGAIAALNDPRVRLVRRARNGGVAAARNTGVAAATGDYIAFHDSDDYCTADRIELSVRALLALPEDYIGIYGARLIYNEVGEKNYEMMRTEILPRPGTRPLNGDLSARTMRGNILNFPTLLVKTEACGPQGRRTCCCARTSTGFSRCD